MDDKKVKDQEDDEEGQFMVAPPDGGWGWVVVFSSFMIHVIADGITYTFGIFFVEFLDYYKQSNAKTSWILSILVGITLGIGPVSSALTNRFGCRIVTIIGAFIASIGLILSIFAPSVEVLFITIGGLTGCGFGFMYLPAIVSVSTYFEKKRAFATGIAVCGSGVGTFIMAPLLQYLVHSYTWKGAMLITAGIIFHCIIFGLLLRPLTPTKPKKKSANEVNCNNIHCNGDFSLENRNLEIVKRASITPMDRINHKANGNITNSSIDIYHSQNSLWLSTHGLDARPMYRKDVLYSGSFLSLQKSCHSLHTASMASIPKPHDINHEWKVLRWLKCSEAMSFAFQEMLDLSILKEPVYLMFVVSNFLTSIGFNVPFVYTKNRALHEGVDDESAGYLLSVIGISNMVGRVVIGYMSDKPYVNRLYLYNVLLTICGFATTFSYICTEFWSMSVYCSIFGITAGAYVGLTSVILVDLFGIEKLTNGFGILLLFQGAASLIGPPIAGFLYDLTESYDVGYQVVGVCIALSGLMLFFIPYLSKKVEIDRRKFNSKSETVIPSIILSVNEPLNNA